MDRKGATLVESLLPSIQGSVIRKTLYRHEPYRMSVTGLVPCGVAYHGFCLDLDFIKGAMKPEYLQTRRESGKLWLLVWLVPLVVPGVVTGAPPMGGQLSTLEGEVVREVNLARSEPQQYATLLEQWKTFYKGQRIERPGKPTIVTEEGTAAVDEAIDYLRRLRARPTLTLSIGMSRGAKDHANEMGPAGALGHRGVRGSWPTERINRYGRWQEAVGENIYYGEGNAREIVMWLIIDDGIPGRDHRRTTFNPLFHVIGVGCGAHAAYGTMCVLTFAGAYNEAH